MSAKKYKRKSYLYHFISIMALILPFAGWLLVRRDEYFNENATATAFGLILTMLVVGLLLKGAFKTMKKELGTVIMLSVFIGITTLLKAVLYDLQWILIIALAAYALYIPFNSIAVRYGKKGEIMEDEELRQEVRSGRA